MKRPAKQALSKKKKASAEELLEQVKHLEELLQDIWDILYCEDGEVIPDKEWSSDELPQISEVIERWQAAPDYGDEPEEN